MYDLSKARCEMNDDKFTVTIPCKQEPDPIIISAISRKEFEDKLEEAWLLYREKGYKVVFVDKSYGITWQARVELYENSIPLDMQQYKQQFVKTERGWFRMSTAGICDCCGVYKELNTLNERGHICDSCSDPISF